MLIAYLWTHRQRPGFASPQWCKAWAKRVLTLPALFESSIRQGLLRFRGGRIDAPVFMARCVMNGPASNLRVGSGSFIGRVALHLHDRIEIGENVVINDGAILLTASHDVGSRTFAGTRKPIVIGDHAWIATGAIILPGVVIGKGAVVAAGAVVSKPIPDFKIACGNPAQIMDRERADNLEYSPVRLVAAFSAWLGPQPEGKSSS